MNARISIFSLIALLVLGAIHPARAELEFEREPINYNEPTSEDRVSRLQSALDVGEITLEFDDRHGYLPAVLELLGIPHSSQTLVFCARRSRSCSSLPINGNDSDPDASSVRVT